MGTYLNPGNSGFEKIRNSIYVDKSGLIEAINRTIGTMQKLTCISRPRRFGKSFAAQMLCAYYDKTCDSAVLFDDLEIAEVPGGSYRKHLNQYDVIYLDMTNIMGESKKDDIVSYIRRKVSEELKDAYPALQVDEESFSTTLIRTAELAGNKFIMIIDEWDAPIREMQEIQKAYLDFLRSLFKSSGTTDRIFAAVYMTGILPIKKDGSESAISDFWEYSMLEPGEFQPYVGFTEKDVKKLCGEHRLDFEEAKKWYDGYQFGNASVYCPWDVLNHCDRIRSEPQVQPENYWLNTSSNDAVKRFIQESANATTKREIERLVAGEVIVKEIHQELTYSEIYQTIDNIWSLLFTTGYLTQRGKAEGRQMKLAIPNLEIRDIFVTQIMEFFRENVREDGDTLNCFCDALQNEDPENVEKIFTEYLRRTISIRDTAVRTEMKENFYHGILLGILGVKTRWGISSNREMGEGYADILAEPDTRDMGIIIEVKYAHDGDLDAACKEALKQIEYTRYEDDLEDDGVENILKYGIACYKKRCRVMLTQK